MFCSVIFHPNALSSSRAFGEQEAEPAAAAAVKETVTTDACGSIVLFFQNKSPLPQSLPISLVVCLLFQVVSSKH